MRDNVGFHLRGHMVSVKLFLAVASLPPSSYKNPAFPPFLDGVVLYNFSHSNRQLFVTIST